MVERKFKHGSSVLYEQVLIHAGNPAKANDQLASANQLEAEFKDTPYASLSALVVAKQQMAAGKFDKAQQQYKWVVDNAKQLELKYLAKIRLSRLLLTTQQYDQALTILSEPYPESFASMVFELKGDVLSTQGNKAQARTAYIEAQLMSKDENRWLQLKIDDIGGDVTADSKLEKGTEPSA